MKLLKVVKSTNPKKKYDAFFDNNHKTSFGAYGYLDYLQHHDKERRERYRARHKKDLDTRDPTKAGYLSYYLLWGDSTDLQTNIRNYKRLFHL